MNSGQGSRNARSGCKRRIWSCTTSIIPRVRGLAAEVIIPVDCLFCVHSDALAARLGTISLEAQSKLEQDTAKKEAKADIVASKW